jgi:hypothetical protein
MRAFTADLERILAGLGPHTPDGPCDSDCGCLTDAPAAPVASTLTSGPVACTLDAADMPRRLQEWRDVVRHVVDRLPIDGGTRLQLDTDAPLDRLALLVAAEQGCCNFFAFAITVDRRGVALEVRAPAQSQAVLDSLFSGEA